MLRCPLCIGFLLSSIPSSKRRGVLDEIEIGLATCERRSAALPCIRSAREVRDQHPTFVGRCEAEKGGTNFFDGTKPRGALRISSRRDTPHPLAVPSVGPGLRSHREEGDLNPRDNSALRIRCGAQVGR